MEKLNQKTVKLFKACFLLAAITCTFIYQRANAQTGTAFAGKRLGNSFEYKNLKIVLIEGDAILDHKKYLTLDQALERKKVKVRETGNVNELAIDNLSAEYVFIHSGDIVKGGQQDRTIANDMIIAPYAKKVNLASFCVEHSRWNKRGNENVREFSTSKNMLPSKKLKIASRYQNNQQEVWNKVEEEQTKYTNELSKKANKNVVVKSEQSASSLQLALENDSLIKSKDEYMSHLKGLFGNNPQALGMVIYINSELSEINIYNNHALFKDLFTKLVDAAIMEAISEGEKTVASVAATAQMQQMLTVRTQADTVYAKNINLNTRITTVTNKKKMVLLFETEDKPEHKLLHYSYLKADESTFKADTIQQQRIRSSNNINMRMEY